ncbi:MAG: competence/damage-inducible protein A [Chloroflexota bacterium]
MDAVLLSIGSELLRGDIVDANAAYLARELSAMGFTVRRVVQVGDDLEELTGVLRRVLSLADLVICTGGLGPTEDDLTRPAIASALQEEMFTDEALVEELERRFAAMNREMAPNNLQQAQRIAAAEPLANPNGSAPGWYVRKGSQIVVAMPGPPAEMQPMWRNKVVPRLRSLSPGGSAELTLLTFGMGESDLETRIADLLHRYPGVTIATYAKSTGVEVHLAARGDDTEGAQVLLAGAAREVRQRLGETVYGEGNGSLAQAVGRILRQRGLTISTMESVTGGELSSMLADVPGISSNFIGGIIAYNRDVKEAGGVPKSVIEAHGLISAETAEAMANAIRRGMGADIGIGVTGIAGVDPVEGKPPGTCYVAVSQRHQTVSQLIRRSASRQAAKRYFAQSALYLLRQQLLFKEPADS